MEMNHVSVYLSGLAIIFFYAMSQFNKVPPAGRILSPDGSTVIDTIRGWFRIKELPPPRILPPLRANTTAFKYWLYRIAYAVIWIIGYTVIIVIPGVSEPLPAIIEIVTGSDEMASLNLTNGIVVAFVIMTLTRIPPFRGADATIRHAMYERASIPAQQLGFQYLLRGASYKPVPLMVEKIRKALVADGFVEQDIELDPDPTTRSLWTRTCVLVKFIESWGEQDRYKTALALLRDPDSEKLTAERVRTNYDALKSDARICLNELRQHPDATETKLREEQFRRDCKAILESIYSLLTHVALRSHYSYFDAIASIKKIGFKIEGSVAPLPDKNDVIALTIILFFVTTIPLAYKLGLSKALTITGIYLLAVLTPIYLAVECPRLLKMKRGGMPPLAFPLVAGVIASLLAALVSISMGSVCSGDECSHLLAINLGLDRLFNRSYPWVVLVGFLTILLASLMLLGGYPNPNNQKGLNGYRRYGNLRDACALSAGVMGLMALYIIPELHQLRPERFPENDFWRAPGLMLRPSVTAFFIGFFVPTWYRGNATRIGEKGKRQSSEDQPQVHNVPVSP